MLGFLRNVKRTVGKMNPFRLQASNYLSTIQKEDRADKKTQEDLQAKLALNLFDLHVQEMAVRLRIKRYNKIREKLQRDLAKGNDFCKMINFPRFSMQLDTSDGGSIYTVACYFTNLLEPVEISVFGEMICRNPDSLVIDIGANYGLYTLYACDLARYNIVYKIVAVEPDRRVFQKLSKSIHDNGFDGKVTLINKAVSDIDNQQVDIFINSVASVDNRTISNGGINFVDHYIVETINIDSIVAEVEQNICKPKNIIIKMDIQGNEPRAFCGMLNTMKNYSSIAILFELDPSHITSAGLDPYQFANELFAAGFDRYVDVNETLQSLRSLNSIDDLTKTIRHCKSMGKNDPRRYTTILAYRGMIGPKALEMHR